MMGINENIQALFEMGKIEKPDDRLAMEFCKTSKMGEYKCAVKNRFGFFCDLCIEDEKRTVQCRHCAIVPSV